MTHAPIQPRFVASRRAFSLVEMVMVIATLGIIMMIAVPRMSGAATDAQASAVVANVTILQNSIETYAAEHNNLNPAQNADQSVSVSAARFMARLTNNTTEMGQAGGIYGPYLLRVPRNPANGQSTIRVDGAPAGANLAGWRFDTDKQQILPDHLDEATAMVLIVQRKGGSAALRDLGNAGKPAADAELGVSLAAEP